jgi:hypothetical protein
MNHIPSLWGAAYGSQRSPIGRFAALCIIRITAFGRMLALADHRPFMNI